MLMQKDFIDRLKVFGLNSYEAKIWIALLSRGVASAGELSDISNVPRSRSYDVLESLEKKGFIVMKIGKPIKYIAVSPQEVIERVKQRVDEEAKSQSESLEELKSSPILGELSTLHDNGVDLVEPSDLTASFKGRDKVYSQMQLMLKEAEETFDLVTTDQGLERKADYLARAFKKANDRGVRVRIAIPGDDINKDILELLSQYADIRQMKNIKARFAIADGQEISFLLFHDEDVHPTYDVGVWVNTPFFSQAVESLFNIAWEDLPQLTVSTVSR
ncbi:MAG: TrmB family transcriptional regulator [Nanobdellota archaeon]